MMNLSSKKINNNGRMMKQIDIDRLRDVNQDVNHRNFIRLIKNRAITPYFQPIYDLYTGDIFGYEVLSRGEPPFINPVHMFQKAEELDLILELEYACRLVALQKIASLPNEFKQKKFFLNVSPLIFNNPSFSQGFSMGELKEIGIDFQNIIIEITESSSVEDYSGFEKLIHHYVEQGFQVALDDFGAGHSGLVTLVAMTPHFLKLDRAIISNIHFSSYKQKLIKAISSFSTNVETYMIGEGIEKIEELEDRKSTRLNSSHYS